MTNSGEIKPPFSGGIYQSGTFTRSIIVSSQPLTLADHSPDTSPAGWPPEAGWSEEWVSGILRGCYDVRRRGREGFTSWKTRALRQVGWLTRPNNLLIGFLRGVGVRVHHDAEMVRTWMQVNDGGGDYGRYGVFCGRMNGKGMRMLDGGWLLVGLVKICQTCCLRQAIINKPADW